MPRVIRAVLPLPILQAVLDWPPAFRARQSPAVAAISLISCRPPMAHALLPTETLTTEVWMDALSRS